MGSVLKMISGALDSAQQRKADEARLKLIYELKGRRADKNFQASIFGDSEAAVLYGRHTRRIIAIIGVCNFFVLTVLAILFPTAEITTFTLPEFNKPFTLLWGLISIPSNKPITVILTTGHIAIVGLHILAIIFGFYFTPGGRQK